MWPLPGQLAAISARRFGAAPGVRDPLLVAADVGERFGPPDLIAVRRRGQAGCRRHWARNSWGVTILSPVRAATSGVKCAVLEVTNQSGSARIAVASTGTSWTCRI